jgi:hypothetical protein
MNIDSKPACADPAIEPSMFFPPLGENDFYDASYKRLWHHQIAEALEVCSTCPVIEECFRYSISNVNSATIGVYGGLTPPERLKLVGNTRTVYANIPVSQMEKLYAPAREIAYRRGVTPPRFTDVPQIGELNWVEESKELRSVLQLR